MIIACKLELKIWIGGTIIFGLNDYKISIFVCIGLQTKRTFE